MFGVETGGLVLAVVLLMTVVSAAGMGEYRICSLVHGCCDTSEQMCQTDDGRIYTVSVDAWCGGALPSIESAGLDGTFFSACLVPIISNAATPPAATTAPCFSQTMTANAGAAGGTISLKATPIESSSEYTIWYPAGFLCTTVLQSCSNGQIKVSITPADVSCANQHSIAWTMLLTMTACLPLVDSSYYQTLSVQRSLGGDTLTVCGLE